MHNIIHTEANLILESFFTLSQLANPNHESHIRHTFANLPASSPNRALLSHVIAYLDQVEDQLHLPQDRLDFLFKEASPTSSLDSKGALFLQNCLAEADLATFVEKVKAFDASERFNHIRYIMLSMLAHTPETMSEIDTLLPHESALFEQIFKHKELSESEKYDIFYIYYHYEVLLEEFVSFILQTIPIIAPLLEPFQKDVEQLILSMNDSLSTQGIGYFTELFNINLGANSHFSFYPCVSAPLSLTFSNTKATLEHFNIFFGIYVLPFISLKKECQHSEKEIASFLKALADPTKLQILKLIKDERLYASQLAEKLGLTNATVSHHMNVLLQLEILKCEKEQNKFYYALEPTSFKTYLDQIYQEFGF
ncbi:MAG: ArsR/SmtB family transcription factor [Cellulosilyticaceae bacterium]